MSQKIIFVLVFIYIPSPFPSIWLPKAVFTPSIFYIINMCIFVEYICTGGLTVQQQQQTLQKKSDFKMWFEAFHSFSSFFFLSLGLKWINLYDDGKTDDEKIKFYYILNIYANKLLSLFIESKWLISIFNWFYHDLKIG